MLQPENRANAVWELLEMVALEYYELYMLKWHKRRHYNKDILSSPKGLGFQ